MFGSIIDNLLKQDVLLGRQSHVRNYSGIFNPELSYKKFDFVYNTGDGLYYYAKEDMALGAGVSVSAANRYHLCPTRQGGFFIVDSLNRPDDIGATFEKGNIIDLDGSSDSDGRYSIFRVSKDIVHTSPIIDFKGQQPIEITGAYITVAPVSDQYSFDSFEAKSSNTITITTLDADPSVNNDLWVRDRFFFDPDYGSTVNFKSSNKEVEMGNGYKIVTPSSVNSLLMSVDMKFKNRSNRESNAIIHFVENHLGQLEKDKTSPNLAYTQGISGFHWDGESSFHPYDTVENQSKTFYCTEFSHNLAFENSNNIDLTLRNLDSSLLRKTVQGGWMVGGGEEYDSSTTYEKNDFALYTGNMQYYYWEGDSPGNTAPAGQNSSWTREGGQYYDVKGIDYARYVDDHPDLAEHFAVNSTLNGVSYPAKQNWGEAHYLAYGQYETRQVHSSSWTRDFFWKPSLGLTVSQKPRMKIAGLKNGYSQIYNDGINESLLELNLNFKNRSDHEARAILHFLEQKLGYLPFGFIPPAPYNRFQNFICEAWSHTYNYKNNHDISAKFSQFPFNLKAEKYDGLITPAEMSEGELVFESPLVFATDSNVDRVKPGQKLKARLKLRNIGDLPVTINSATLSNAGLAQIIGADSSNNGIPVVLDSLEREGYIFTGDSFVRGGNVAMKLSKSYSKGTKDGGQIFTVGTIDGNGNFQPTLEDGIVVSLFQNNLGEIKDKINHGDPGNYVPAAGYVVKEFFKQNAVTEIPGGESGYIDIVFTAPSASDLNSDLGVDTEVDEDIVLLGAGSYIEINLEIDSTTAYSPQVGKLKCFVSS
tara:strand:- start:17882 stop:20329 length:2448 start_codon:yes stop_codon:yes gene_type:complete